MAARTMFNLQGKAALITGASGGFDGASARALAHAGSSVVLVGRDQKSLHPLAEELGERTTVVEVDISKEGEPDRVVKEASDARGRIDVLVNAAGGATVGGLIDLSDAAWQAISTSSSSAICG